MSNIKILIDFRNGNEWRNFKIQVGRECTVAHLLFKIRKFIKIKPETAVFCFWQYNGMFGKKEKLYSGNKLLTEIQSELCMEVLEVKLLLENCFGDLDSRFISATIRELNIGVWVLTINYSFYSLYEYKTVNVFKSMDDAVKKLALERCNGKLIITDKSNVVVDIIPK